VDDIEDRGSVFVITIPKTKTNKKQVFTIVNNEKICSLVLYTKYTTLRPASINHRRFFPPYKNNKSTAQPVGKKHFRKCSQDICEVSSTF
ncbi:hypothetical protein BDFB_013151, partial [Asbolus verrucosus]